MSKKFETEKNYRHFLFVHENDVTHVALKKSGTATLSFNVQVHNLEQTNIAQCCKNTV